MHNFCLKLAKRQQQQKKAGGTEWQVCHYLVGKAQSPGQGYLAIANRIACASIPGHSNSPSRNSP
jgi:hypothetical protein